MTALPTSKCVNEVVHGSQAWGGPAAEVIHVLAYLPQVQVLRNHAYDVGYRSGRPGCRISGQYILLIRELSGSFGLEIPQNRSDHCDQGYDQGQDEGNELQTPDTVHAILTPLPCPYTLSGIRVQCKGEGGKSGASGEGKKKGPAPASTLVAGPHSQEPFPNGLEGRF